jgi:hypothetical protein
MSSMTITSAQYEPGNQMIALTIGGLIVSVPLDPANRHYQAYLEWLAEGNEPLPADTPE